MVKNKPIKILNLFTVDLSIKKMLILNGIFLLILAILNVIKTMTGYNPSMSSMEAFFYSIIGTLIITVIFYGIFFVFLNAYEIKKKKFLESFLVFLAVSLPYVIIVHILNWIGAANYGMITVLMSLLMLLTIIVFIVMLIISLKRYFETSGYKIVASLVLVNVIFITLGTLQYLSYLILNLR